MAGEFDYSTMNALLIGEARVEEAHERGIKAEKLASAQVYAIITEMTASLGSDEDPRLLELIHGARTEGTICNKFLDEAYREGWELRDQRDKDGTLKPCNIDLGKNCINLSKL